MRKRSLFEKAELIGRQRAPGVQAGRRRRRYRRHRAPVKGLPRARVVLVLGAVEVAIDFDVQVRELRLQRARKAIERDDVSAAQAAYEAGYSNPANFSTAFKRLFGLSPSDVRG